MPRPRFTVFAAISFALAILFLGTYFVREAGVMLWDDSTAYLASVGVGDSVVAVGWSSSLTWPGEVDWVFRGYRLPDGDRLLYFDVQTSLSLPGGGRATLYVFPIWCMSAVFLIPPALWLVKRQKNRGRGFQVLPPAGAELSSAIRPVD